MPDERVIVLVISSRRVMDALRDAGQIVLAVLLVWAYLFFGLL